MNENVPAEFSDETHSSDWFAQVVEAAYRHELVGTAIGIRGKVDAIGRLDKDGVRTIATNIHMDESVSVHAVALERNKSRQSYYPVIYGLTHDGLFIKAGSGLANNALEIKLQ